MKKLLLLCTVIFSASVSNAQTDASVMLTLNNASVVTPTSGSDVSFIATLPSGENIVANHIVISTGESVINIKKISATGTVSTLKNLIIPVGAVTYSNLKGISCSATGNFTCLFGELSDLYIVKFNTAGAVLWQKHLNVPEVVSTYYNHSLDETPTGE